LDRIQEEDWFMNIFILKSNNYSQHQQLKSVHK
jgi:hypothetical protein